MASKTTDDPLGTNLSDQVSASGVPEVLYAEIFEPQYGGGISDATDNLEDIVDEDNHALPIAVYRLEKVIKVRRRVNVEILNG